MQIGESCTSQNKYSRSLQTSLFQARGELLAILWFSKLRAEIVARKKRKLPSNDRCLPFRVCALRLGRGADGRAHAVPTRGHRADGPRPERRRASGPHAHHPRRRTRSLAAPAQRRYVRFLGRHRRALGRAPMETRSARRRGRDGRDRALPRVAGPFEPQASAGPRGGRRIDRGDVSDGGDVSVGGDERRAVRARRRCCRGAPGRLQLTRLAPRPHGSPRSTGPDGRRRLAAARA